MLQTENRLRFSLRTLLLLTLAAGCAMLAAQKWDAWPVWMDVPSFSEFPTNDFLFSPSGTRLAVWTPEQVETWDLAARQKLASVTGDAFISQIGWIGEGQLVLACRDHRLRVVDAATGALLRTLGDGVATVTGDMSVNADGTRIATYVRSESQPITLWDARSGVEVWSLKDRLFAWFSPDGRLFLVRNGKNSLEIRDSTNGGLATFYTRANCEIGDEVWLDSRTVRCVEAEVAPAGELILPDGRSAPIYKQVLRRLTLRMKDGDLKEVASERIREETSHELCFDLRERKYHSGVFRDGRSMNVFSILRNGASIWDLTGSTLISTWPFSRSDFSPDGQYVATSLLHTKERAWAIRVWRNRRPEAWWGMAWVVEAWVALGFLVAAGVSWRRDRAVFHNT